MFLRANFLQPASKQDRDYMMSFESRQDFISEFCFILQKQRDKLSMCLLIATSITFWKSGGDERDRTAYLLHAMQALYQLSYTPVLRRNETIAKLVGSDKRYLACNSLKTNLIKTALSET